MDEPGAPAADGRLHFIEEYVLKLKPERWHKCLSAEENKAVLHKFLEKAEEMVLVVVLTPAGLLLPLSHFPSAIKNKAVYFLKRSGALLSPDSARSSMLYGDLSSAPLGHFSAMVEEVIVPVVANQKNHQNWPLVVSRDVMRHVNSLKSSTIVMAGQVHGKTLLPLPSGSEKVEYIDCDTEKKENGPFLQCFPSVLLGKKTPSKGPGQRLCPTGFIFSEMLFYGMCSFDI